MLPFGEETYRAHRLAIEGKVFYKNELTEPEWVERFFPRTPGQVTYSIDPKISFPITSDILNQFASLLYRDSVVTVEPSWMQVYLDQFLERNKWHSLGREIVVKALYGATCLAVIQPFSNTARIGVWSGEWTFILNENTDYEQIGYCYHINKDGKREPLLTKPDKEENAVIVPITDTMWGDMEHQFGFRPAVMFYGIDEQDDSPYPLPFHLRYRQQNLEYNRIWSQIILNIRVLQNVWKTNKDRFDPNNPLTLNPRTINYLGENGMLEQVVRELKIEPELETLDRLKKHIAQSAQVPEFMTGLQGVGKVESGVALNIVFSPLTQVMNRIKRDVRPQMIELLTKGLYAEYIMQRRMFPPDFAIDIRFTDNVIPVDKEKELSMIERADTLGVLQPEEKRMLVAPLLGLEA